VKVPQTGQVLRRVQKDPAKSRAGEGGRGLCRTLRRAADRVGAGSGSRIRKLTLATQTSSALHDDPPPATRRDFLYVATGAVAAVAAGGVAWPLINQMNPDASVLALASIEFDLSGIDVGQSVTIKWRGLPVFVRHRTPEEIQAAVDTPLSELKDPATDAERT